MLECSRCGEKFEKQSYLDRHMNRKKLCININQIIQKALKDERLNFKEKRIEYEEKIRTLTNQLKLKDQRMNDIKRLNTDQAEAYYNELNDYKKNTEGIITSYENIIQEKSNIIQENKNIIKEKNTTIEKIMLFINK